MNVWHEAVIFKLMSSGIAVVVFGLTNHFIIGKPDSSSKGSTPVVDTCNGRCSAMFNFSIFSLSNLHEWFILGP